jgi:hypothetical protein
MLLKHQSRYADALCKWILGFAVALSGIAARADNPVIAIAESELHVSYGQNVQLQVGLSNSDQQQVSWQIVDEVLPPGLTLSDSTTQVTEISGLAYFTEQWCFTLAAVSTDNQIIASRPVCFNSDNVTTQQYPKLSTKKYLDKAVVNTAYSCTMVYCQKVYRCRQMRQITDLLFLVSQQMLAYRRLES